MILAAGRGERMRPLTDYIPKPLLEAGGKPLIVHQIERLRAAGFKQLVINVAWQGMLIETPWATARPWASKSASRANLTVHWRPPAAFVMPWSCSAMTHSW